MVPIQLRAKEAAKEMCFLQRPQVLLLFCISWQAQGTERPMAKSKCWNPGLPECDLRDASL